MIEEVLNDAIEKITIALQKRPKNTITGALLGELIMDETPEINIREVMKIPAGPGALRKFIDLYLKNVLEFSHKQGSDVVYVISGLSSPKTRDADPALWQAFVRTSSSKILVLHGAVLQLEDVDFENNYHGKVIPSATSNELNQIRIDFIKSLGEKANSLPDMAAPYADWSAALRKLGREYYRNWTEYRLRKIEDIFGKRLEVLEIEPKVRSELRSQIRCSQLSGKGSTNVKNNQPNLQKNSNVVLTDKDIDFDDVNFRLAIIEVVKRVSISELRALMLPAGQVADALIRQSMK